MSDKPLPLADAASVEAVLISQKNAKQAEHHLRFFKTAPGEYGAGDKFLGLTVPQVRAVAKRSLALGLIDVGRLLDSPWHEVRLCALQILVGKFRRAGEEERRDIVGLYLKNTARINNWDLVDLSVSILGEWFADKDRAVLYEMARSQLLWERRMAMVGTLTFIKKGDFADALAIAEMLLSDSADLMHKAVGWMLREVGKKDADVLREFLARHYRQMPRTALRYAIERFPDDERRAWLLKPR
ncbi:DNA alkylation repair protein [bacterium]|nr:DNA alkylation repair protein [bacterium]